MKNIPDLDAKLQMLSHSTSSILYRLRWSSIGIFKTVFFLSVTYRKELWVNYPSIIEQITSNEE